MSKQRYVLLLIIMLQAVVSCGGLDDSNVSDGDINTELDYSGGLYDNSDVDPENTHKNDDGDTHNEKVVKVEIRVMDTNSDQINRKISTSTIADDSLQTACTSDELDSRRIKMEICSRVDNILECQSCIAFPNEQDAAQCAFQVLAGEALFSAEVITANEETPLECCANVYNKSITIDAGGTSYFEFALGCRIGTEEGNSEGYPCNFLVGNLVFDLEPSDSLCMGESTELTVVPQNFDIGVNCPDFNYFVQANLLPSGLITVTPSYEQPENSVADAQLTFTSDFPGLLTVRARACIEFPDQDVEPICGTYSSLSVRSENCEVCTCSELNDCCDGCQSINNGENCNDSLYCSVGDTCIDGICIGNQERDCDDSNVCTTDSCSEIQSQCLHTTNTLACDDGNPETTNDQCSAGLCSGTECRCSIVNACCDGCQPINEYGNCDDGSYCTHSDSCVDGHCIGSTEYEDDCQPFVVHVDPSEMGSQIWFWPASGSQTRIVSVGPEGDTLFSVGGDECAATVTWIGQAASWEDRTFPSGAPQGQCDLCTFTTTVPFWQLHQNSDAWGCAHDGYRPSNCYNQTAHAGQFACVEEDGRFYIRLGDLTEITSFPGGGIDYTPISDSDFVDWVLPVWFDLEQVPGYGWWLDLPLIAVENDVALARIPEDLPSGLCPLESSGSKHPMRLGTPRKAGSDIQDNDMYAQGMPSNSSAYQNGLATAGLPDQNHDPVPYVQMVVAKYPSHNSWSPAASVSLSDMYGEQIHCSP